VHDSRKVAVPTTPINDASAPSALTSVDRAGLEGEEASLRLQFGQMNPTDAADASALLASARTDDRETFLARAWSWLGRRVRFAGGSAMTSFAGEQSYADMCTHGIADLPAVFASYEKVRATWTEWARNCSPIPAAR
jgi:hypothetical protein